MFFNGSGDYSLEHSRRWPQWRREPIFATRLHLSTSVVLGAAVRDRIEAWEEWKTQG